MRSLTFTFQRTANPAAPGGSHSSGSQQKSTPRRPSRSFTAAKSAVVIYGSISPKTAHGLRVSAVILAALRPIAAATPAVAISIVVEATTEVAAAATAVRTRGRRSPRAVAEGCAARSEACSGVVVLASWSWLPAPLDDRNKLRNGLKVSGEV